MTSVEPVERRVLILAPIGRDGAAIAEVLKRVGLDSLICRDVPGLVAVLDAGAGAVVISEEALFGEQAPVLAAWVGRQKPWSDIPFIILIARQGRPDLMRWRQELLLKLHNATLVEKPLNALALSSVSVAAVRSRQRQYEVRDYIATRAAAAETLEELVVSRTRELEAANASLRVEMAERARAEDALRQSQKMEAVGQLTGGIAHDFNNMLQGITGGIALARMRMPPQDEQVTKFLDLATSAAERATALTRRLLAFGRRQPLNPKLVALEELIQDLKALIERTVGPAIFLEIRLRDGCWPVRCDPNQLENALLNLAINARDAMPDGGRLLIETAHVDLSRADTQAWEGAKPGDYVRITVSDTGIGMTPDVLTHAFEPFFTTKPDGHGTGLGLSQLYGFVRQSHGAVRLETEVGAGTSVHMYLPRTDDVPDATKDTAPTVTTQQPVEVGGAATVLLVDDEAIVRASAAEVLRLRGWKVIEAEDGRTGLQALHQALRNGKTNAIDLLVADIGLPGGLNGRQLADAARAAVSDLPVLLITGYAGRTLNGKGKLESGMELLVKPFTLDDLAERVQSMIKLAKATN
jgi:signal transduction histidine kinase/ActR/RegA family two-component response regulator